MSILADSQVEELIRAESLVSPASFYKRKRLQGKDAPSYGLSSMGYDVTIGNNLLFPVFDQGVIDPVGKSQWYEVEVKGEYFDLPPHSFCLAHTNEVLNMPSDVMGVVFGKSTYARCGLVMPMTPLEPGWEGQVTLEIANTTHTHVRIYINAGVAQIVFLKSKQRPVNDYCLGGTYQGTMGVVPAGDYDIVHKTKLSSGENISAYLTERVR